MYYTPLVTKIRIPRLIVTDLQVGYLHSVSKAGMPNSGNKLNVSVLVSVIQQNCSIHGSGTIFSSTRDFHILFQHYEVFTIIASFQTEFPYSQSSIRVGRTMPPENLVKFQFFFHINRDKDITNLCARCHGSSRFTYTNKRILPARSFI